WERFRKQFFFIASHDEFHRSRSGVDDHTVHKKTNASFRSQRMMRLGNNKASADLDIGFPPIAFLGFLNLRSSVGDKFHCMPIIIVTLNAKMQKAILR